MRLARETRADVRVKGAEEWRGRRMMTWRCLLFGCLWGEWSATHRREPTYGNFWVARYRVRCCQRCGREQEEEVAS